MKMSDIKPSVVHRTKPTKVQRRKLSREDKQESSYKQTLSKTKIVAAEKRHNAKVKKMARENFGIPVVFGGMNTV